MTGVDSLNSVHSAMGREGAVGFNPHHRYDFLQHPALPDWCFLGRRREDAEERLREIEYDAL
jgi:hypothetical protein